MVRCSKCILPNTLPHISYNQEGVCNYCQEYVSPQLLGEGAFIEHIELARKKNNKYDCIVALSGGRDSTYVLYVAKKIYKLNILAVTYDNEFLTDEAVANINRICKRLEVDSVIVKSQQSIVKKGAAYFIKYAVKNKSSCLASRDFCLLCMFGVKSTMYRVAREYKVPLIITGFTPHDEAYLRIAREQFGGPQLGSDNRYGGLAKIWQECDLNKLMFRYCQLMQIIEFPFFAKAKPSSFLKMHYRKRRGIISLSLFKYILWDRALINHALAELGWEKPHASLTTWRVDCKFRPLIEYCYKKLFGCSQSCFGYHALINARQMTRDEALAHENAFSATMSDGLKSFLMQDIGLTSENVTSIIESD